MGKVQVTVAPLSVQLQPAVEDALVRASKVSLGWLSRYSTTVTVPVAAEVELVLLVTVMVLRIFWPVCTGSLFPGETSTSAALVLVMVN